MKIIRSTKNIKGKYHIKNSTCRNISIKAATNKNSSVRLQMKEELMDQILSEIKSKLKEVMTSYQFGYDDNEWEDYSGADIYLDNRGYIVITVYAEVSYNGLVKIMDALNPIVEKYDSDAYFDADTPGRCSAYIDPDNVPSNMYPYDDIQNSEKIYSDDSIMFEGNNYEYVTNNHGYWIYRTVVDGKGVWRAMKQDSDESQFDKLSFPITYEQARGDKPIGEPNSIARLRKDLGKKLLPKSGQSVEATEDLSSYPEEFRNAYQKAKTEFINRYPNLGVSIIRDDPYAEDGEVAVLVKDYDTGDHAKCYLVYSVDELISSDYEWMLQAFEETAEAIGLLEDNTVYSSVESSDYESDSGIFIEDIIDSLEDNGYDLTRIRSIRQGLLKLFGYKGKDADIIIHDLVAGRFIDPNDWVDKDYTPGIYGATDDGEGYWFFTTHGVQPGSVPRDVDILDIIDTPNGSFVKFNRFLSTKELNEYDMVEKAPKSVMSSKESDVRLGDTVEGASNEVELDPEESMIDMNIDQYIIVDSEGSWDYDSDNYNWASSDGEGSDWYSDNGVRLDDPTGVVEKIDELIEPHVPIEPGTYRVQGYVELYYTVSGVYENRYDYTEDDYSSDINSDFGSAEYNKKLSKIEDVKVTKI